ncbi:MAG: ECF transporter S component [Clostridia bacterium]|nr:ECF transporter S component [Clostridia bacterium]
MYYIMKMLPKRDKIFSTGNLVRMAVLAAIASVLFLIEIPVVAFYKLDFSNLPVLLGAFSMGTLPGVIILAVKSVIGLLHSSSSGVGELADFLMGAAMVIPASLIYHHSKTRKNAVIGMLTGTMCMIIVSVFANKYIMLPFYMGAYHMDMDAILAFAGVKAVNSEWKLLLLVTAPFNLLKGIALSVVTALIYKPLSPVLHEKRA